MKIFAKVIAGLGLVGSFLMGLAGQVGAAWTGSSLVDSADVTALSGDAQAGFQMLIATLLDFAPYIILVAFGWYAMRLISRKIG